MYESIVACQRAKDMKTSTLSDPHYNPCSGTLAAYSLSNDR